MEAELIELASSFHAESLEGHRQHDRPSLQGAQPEPRDHPGGRRRHREHHREAAERVPSSFLGKGHQRKIETRGWGDGVQRAVSGRQESVDAAQLGTT